MVMLLDGGVDADDDWRYFVARWREKTNEVAEGDRPAASNAALSCESIGSWVNPAAVRSQALSQPNAHFVCTIGNHR